MSLDLDGLYRAADYLAECLSGRICDAADYRLQRVMWIAAFHAVYQGPEISESAAAKCADAALDQYRERFGG